MYLYNATPAALYSSTFHFILRGIDRASYLVHVVSSDGLTSSVFAFMSSSYFIYCIYVDVVPLAYFLTSCRPLSPHSALSRS